MTELAAAGEAVASPPADPGDAALAAEIEAARLPRKRRHRPVLWTATILGAVLVVFAAGSLVDNQALQWDVVGKYLFNHAVLEGLWLSIWVTLVVTVLALLLGGVLAAMRLSGAPFLVAVSWGYVWVFRAVPVLVQLMVWFNIGYLYPVISFGIPWGPTFFAEPSRNLVSALAAALIGLTLHESAFAAEIIRGGVLSVDAGQREAAHALALGPVHTFCKIVLPQAMRSILPNAGSLLVGTLKSTTLVSVIAVSDLLYSVQIIYNRTFEVVPLLLVACIWYLLITSVLSVLQFALERHYGRGAGPLWRWGSLLPRRQEVLS